MKRTVSSLALVLAGCLPAPGAVAQAAPSAPRPQLAAAAGITPGDLLYSVGPAEKKLILAGADGTLRTSFDLLPSEINVLGVADRGARVTSPTPDGLAPVDPRLASSGEDRIARLVFRDSKGNVLATREPPVLAGSALAFSGDECYFVRRTGREYGVYRTNPAEAETLLFRLTADRIRKETGKVSQVSLFASPAGLVAEFIGPYRSVYVDARQPDRLVSPDPALTCGRRPSSAVFPRTAGGISRISPGPALARLESFDVDGRVAGSVDLEPASKFQPLADGTLLAIRDKDAILLDARGKEISRARLPAGLESLALKSASRSFKWASPSVPEGATGREWAEASLRNGVAFASMGVASRDPAGVLTRLSQVPDGDAFVPRARTALRSLLNTRGFEGFGAPRTRPAGEQPVPAPDPARWDRILGTARKLAESGAPQWFRRMIAFSLLSTKSSDAPAWAMPAVVDSMVAGEESSGLSSLPEEVFTPSFAELASGFERDRIDRLEREAPDSPARSWADFEESFERMGQLQLHLPAARFPGLVLACVAGAGPARFEAVVTALALPAMELWASPSNDELDEDAPQMPAPGGDMDAHSGEKAAAVSALLGYALHGGGADERAVAMVLSPLYRLPLDAQRYRESVLSRPGAENVAIGFLPLDRSLDSIEWTKLFSDVLAAARGRAANPLSCLSMAEGPPTDRYCQMLVGTFGYAMISSPGNFGMPSLRQKELVAFSQSQAAPPEVRLQGRLARAAAGMASTDEILEVWREKELPWAIRSAAVAARKDQPQPAGFSSALERELRTERLTPAEASRLLESLRTVDEASARRLAMERWEKGDVPLAAGDEHSTSPWIASLDPKDLEAFPRVRDSLRKAMQDEENGPAAAAVLSKAGDPTALPHVLEAVRTGCLG